MSLSKKQLISEHFSKAAASYDGAAQLQIAVIEQASKYLMLSTETNLLDVGCGTANLIRFARGNTYLGCDISTGMLKTAQHKVESSVEYQKRFSQFDFSQADAHQLPFDDNSFDIVFSSLAWQWCDLTQVLQQAYRVCKPGGQIVFTTLLADTLSELKQAFAALDSNNHVNNFLTIEQAQQQIEQANVRCSVFEVVNHQTQYSSVRALLKELKAIGANTVVNRDKSNALTRAKLQQLENVYPKLTTVDKNKDSGNITASWQTLYCCIYKANQ
ncbi:biotin synthesis protein BioC [Catenovulum agarivorans DS-2]|uniref:Biotin synthesis protein BioC n=1 Tax=Catenovulum agarivorans DS-2 TaxID=1328313 RepID=W7QKK0_9ALTE|nr:methyltransferase domain-containing protein [Catenovulum agarivorans]EWH08598.1 biotin synthesis protein BioC [Catenovulum agarivorans DS-2]